MQWFQCHAKTSGRKGPETVFADLDPMRSLCYLRPSPASSRGFGRKDRRELKASRSDTTTHLLALAATGASLIP